jgi:hypothetical protein
LHPTRLNLARGEESPSNPRSLPENRGISPNLCNFPGPRANHASAGRLAHLGAAHGRSGRASRDPPLEPAAEGDCSPSGDQRGREPRLTTRGPAIGERWVGRVALNARGQKYEWPDPRRGRFHQINRGRRGVLWTTCTIELTSRGSLLALGPFDLTITSRLDGRPERPLGYRFWFLQSRRASLTAGQLDPAEMQSREARVADSHLVPSTLQKDRPRATLPDQFDRVSFPKAFPSSFEFGSNP